jgi:hypothetical protein
MVEAVRGGVQGVRMRVCFQGVQQFADCAVRVCIQGV